MEQKKLNRLIEYVELDSELTKMMRILYRGQYDSRPMSLRKEFMEMIENENGKEVLQTLQDIGFVWTHRDRYEFSCDSTDGGMATYSIVSTRYILSVTGEVWIKKKSKGLMHPKAPDHRIEYMSDDAVREMMKQEEKLVRDLMGVDAGYALINGALYVMRRDGWN